MNRNSKLWNRFRNTRLLRRAWLLPFMVILTLIGGVTQLTTSAVLAAEHELEACIGTVETTDGQGRFSVSGLGRFSVSGLEGANATLEPGDGGLTQAEVDEILNNVIDQSWLLDVTSAYVDGQSTGTQGFGTNRVAILIVDDFLEQTITLSQLAGIDENTAADLYEQYVDRYGFAPSGSLPIEIQPHGVFVQEVAQDLVDAVNAQYPNASLEIDVFPVNIADPSVGYRVDLAAQAIQQSVFAALEAGYPRIVVNMSWGAIPCFDDEVILEFGGSGAWDFNQYLNFRNNAFEFDIDGGFDIELQTAPVLLRDYGVRQYIAEQLFGGNVSAADDYMRYLLSALGPDAEEFKELRELMQNFLNQSANQQNDFQLIPIAASGNYRDLFTAPLAPSNLPEIIAVGATLNMGDTRWEYTQDANGIAPGAWYHFGDDSYRAGTSFAAPYMSVVAALYETYPSACKFGEPTSGVTPLTYGAEDYTNYSYWDRVLDCDPGPQGPETPPEFDLRNGGFEVQGPTVTKAAFWAGNAASLARRKCNKDLDGDGIDDKIFSYSGDCALQVKTRSGVKSKAIQSVGFQNLGQGDGVTLTAFVESRNLSAGGKMKLIIKHSDGNRDKDVVNIPTGTSPYQQIAASLTLQYNSPQKVKVIFQMRNGTGKYRVDDVVISGTGNLLQGGPLVPLPLPQP